MPNIEEEDLPLIEPDLIGEDYAPPPPVSGAPLLRAPAIVPQPGADASPAGESDVLKNYFMAQKLQRERLDNAEQTATDNRFMARMGGAFNTLAHAASPKPADNSAFEGMAKDAENPVSRVERQQKLEQGGDKLLLNYFMNKNRAEGLAGYRDKRLGLDEQRIGMQKDRNELLAALAKRRLSQQERGLGLRSRGLTLRETAIASGAVDKINKDKVVTMTEQQLNAANKGLGRLADIDSGKIPFSSTIKADLEADIANLISGSNSASLGKLERVEFKPYAEKWQKMLDSMRGYQGDINTPEYINQLRDQFEGLRNDILEIQVKRRENLLKSNKTAYKNSPLATEALEQAAKTGQEPTAPRPKATPVAPKLAPPPKGFIRVVKTLPNGKKQTGTIPEADLVKTLKDPSFKLYEE